MFFADRYFGFDDAIYASCRLIEILAKTKKPLSSLLLDIPATSVTPEIRVDCPDHQKFVLMNRVIDQISRLAKDPHPNNSHLNILDVSTIDGIRVRFQDGWGLIRASNTQPALVLRFEASTPERLAAFRNFLESQLAACRQELGI